MLQFTQYSSECCQVTEEERLSFSFVSLNESYLRKHTVFIGISVEFQFYNNKIKMLEYCSKYSPTIQILFLLKNEFDKKRVKKHKIFNHSAPRQFRIFAVTKLFHL